MVYTMWWHLADNSIPNQYGDSISRRIIFWEAQNVSWLGDAAAETARCGGSSSMAARAV